MKTQPTAHARIRAARRALVLDHPFFGHLALGLTLRRDTKGCPAMLATDGDSLFYDEERVLAYPEDDLVTAVAHEVMHPALLHHTRRGERDLDQWNDAGDYAINLLLKDAQFQVPTTWLIDERFRGMTTEQIYEALSSDQEEEGDDGNNGAGPTNGNNGMESKERPGCVLDAAQPTQQEAQWQVTVKQAVALSSMMGREPAGMSLAVDKASEPRVDWRSVLRRFVQQLAPSDYSWRRPNRRYIASGLCMPELMAEELTLVALVADTSASTRRVLSVFLAEVQSIIDDCQPRETVVIMADADVQSVTYFGRGESLKVQFIGFGGTDFRPAFGYVDTEQLDPACLIYLTDGEGTFPDRPPEYPTLWAITTPGIEAPWGVTISIDPSMTP